METALPRDTAHNASLSLIRVCDCSSAFMCPPARDRYNLKKTRVSSRLCDPTGDEILTRERRHRRYELPEFWTIPHSSSRIARKQEFAYGLPTQEQRHARVLNGRKGSEFHVSLFQYCSSYSIVISSLITFAKFRYLYPSPWNVFPIYFEKSNCRLLPRCVRRSTLFDLRSSGPRPTRLTLETWLIPRRQLSHRFHPAA